MASKSSPLSARGKAAPVNPTNCHLHGQLLPRCHPMNIGLLVSKILQNLRAVIFSLMKMLAQQLKAFAIQKWQSSRMLVTVASLHTFQELSLSPELKGQRIPRMRMLHLLALKMALHQDATTLYRMEQELRR